MAYVDLSIKNLPEMERPRERLLLKGAAALSLGELLAIILGKGVSGEPVTILAQRIIAKFGDIKDLSKLSVQELISVKGIGLVKACQMVVCFEISRRMTGAPVIKSKEYINAKMIYKLVSPYLSGKHKENFLIVALDVRRRLIAVDNISIGTISQSLVHPREVFKAAINRRASSIVLAHNHPSGDTKPSLDDIKVTQRLVTLSYTLGIPILDHLIVSDNAYCSMKEEAYLS